MHGLFDLDSLSLLDADLNENVFDENCEVGKYQRGPHLFPLITDNNNNV